MKLTLERSSPYLAKALGLRLENLSACFQPATREDFESVVDLRRTLFEGEAPWDDRAYLGWRYEFGEGDPDASNRFWIFKQDGKIWGGVGVEHVQISIDGELRDAYKAMDILVDPVIDGKGLGAWMNLALMERFSIVLAVGSNENSHRLLTRLFVAVPTRQVWKLPISVRGTLGRRFGHGLLTRSLALPGDLVLRAMRRLSRAKMPAGLRLEAVGEIPGDVDAYYERWTMGSLFVHRRADYLTWRFLDNPRRDCHVLGLYEDDALVGYSAYTLSHSGTNDQSEAIILDWFSRSGSPAGASAGVDYCRLLLQETVGHLDGLGARMVSLICSGTHSSRLLRDLHFMKRSGEQPFFVHCGEQELRDRLTQADDWFLTESDSDHDG